MGISRKMTYEMIEVAVDKAIRDISENPRRGLRNLIDMGAQLASGRFLQVLFGVAKQLLNDHDSPYYDLTKHVVHHVEHKNLKDFAMHLGYNSLTYGAGKIRAYEKEHGYNIPWMIAFDLRQEDTNMLTAAEISDTFLQCESMGIYTGMIFVGKNKASLQTVLHILVSHQDSAFFVFAHPEIITEEIANQAAKASNIALMLAMETGAENRAAMEAFKLLLDRKCLYGAYNEYNDQNLKQVMSKEYLQRIGVAHCICFILIREELEQASNIEELSQFIATARTANKYPFFIFDFYDDTTWIDRTISAEGCFLAIRGNGQIATKTMDGLQDDLNIRTYPLSDILDKTMPKV